jgi:hypothetical protein
MNENLIDKLSIQNRLILMRIRIFIFDHVFFQDFHQLHVFHLQSYTFHINDAQIHHLFVNNQLISEF